MQLDSSFCYVSLLESQAFPVAAVTLRVPPSSSAKVYVHLVGLVLLLLASRSCCTANTLEEFGLLPSEPAEEHAVGKDAMGQVFAAQPNDLAGCFGPSDPMTQPTSENDSTASATHKVELAMSLEPRGEMAAEVAGCTPWAPAVPLNLSVMLTNSQLINHLHVVSEGRCDGANGASSALTMSATLCCMALRQDQTVID
jgi:hypothetical protein